MKDIIAQLNDTISARAALVMASDGLLIASDVREGIDLERMAALGAAILNEIVASLTHSELNGFDQIEIATEQGKVILVEAGPTYLLVLLGARLEIGPGSLEIQSAAQRIGRAAKFAVSEG